MMNRALQGFLFGLMTMMLAACGALSPPPPSVGQLINEPVGGLTYSCGSLINTTAGTKNKLGQFEYYPGKSCTFSVGKVTVGTVSSVPKDSNVALHKPSPTPLLRGVLPSSATTPGNGEAPTRPELSEQQYGNLMFPIFPARPMVASVIQNQKPKENHASKRRKQTVRSCQYVEGESA